MRTAGAVRAAACLSVALCIATGAAAEDVKVDADTFGGLAARSIGPAAMSGRISALDAVRGERLTVWVGSASGGVWKSTDGGLRFSPVFDKHTQSIGAVRVDRKDPKVVWVGTGESWLRNSVSVGDGVYKTTDAGETWSRMGLEGTERIARIVIDPADSNTVFVCATGHAFDDHPDRGVYRTRDGGKSWEKVLYVAPDTGCADIAVDPQDGKTLYAAMWQYRRRPDFFTSGGPKGGLHKSTDGGATWRRLAKGLPAGDLGRIAVSVSPANPSVVYATVESRRTAAVKGSEDSALYRSDDRGETFTSVSTSSAVTARPFYFAHLVADPRVADRIYKPGFLLYVSDDGGKTFSTLGGGGFGSLSYHPDCHALWVNPENNEELLMGTDGGVYHSADRGARWRFVGSLPVSQFYHVSYDMAYPYNVYGGLQDNNTWWGPSRQPGGIGNKHWDPVSGGDGFWAFADPNDEDVVYSEYQGGNLFRTRKSTGEAKDIKPSPRQGEPKYRFNWNTPIHLSPTRKGVLYYGAQFLFRSRDQGDSWERISPDLTTNDPARQRQKDSGGLTLDNSTAENNTTIYSISESAKNPDVIWVGTDDGNVQVTRDAGKTWTNVAAAVPGVPKGTWVSWVQAGRFEEGTAYVAFDGHMTGDMKTYVFRTADFGRTWQGLATPAVDGYAHVIIEDVVNPRLLFLGTENGLFASVDGGQQWGRFGGGLPRVAVRDLVIHPREHDLVIATHGRGIYIVDDLTPLRGLTPDVLSSEAAFLGSRAAVLAIPTFADGGWSGDQDFVGATVGEVAQIAYYQRKRHMFGDLKVEVYDESGKLLSTIPGSKRRGVNRVEWAMRQKAPRFPAGAELIYSVGSFFGPRAPEGRYTVKLVKGKETQTTTLDLVPDPRSKHTPADRALQRETTAKLYAHVERLAFLVDSITRLRDDARGRAGHLASSAALRRKLEALGDAMEAQRTALVSVSRGEGISGEEKLREELGMLYGNVNFHEGRPTASQLSRMDVLVKDLDAAWAKFETSAKGALALNAQLEKATVEPLRTLTEDEWRKQAEVGGS